jgi:LysM repeat protein
MVRQIAILLVGLGFLLSSCQPAVVQPTSTLPPTGVLTPYLSPTPTLAKPTATIVVTIPVTPSATPTPFLHTVTNDDTMLGLAFRYGVKLEDLKTANPGVNPNAMTVGSQLVIPLSTDTPPENPTPTAMPVHTIQPHCTGTGDGGAWCIQALRNDLDVSLENLSAWIGLYNPQGENFASQVAYAPLNILRPGDSMPVMAYFAAPLPDEFTARGEVLSATAVSADDARYLDAKIVTGNVAISPEGSQAVISGDAILPAGSPTPSQVWVLVIAYGSDDQILGVRKWKSDSDLHFNTTVYSLGGSIDHIDILSEVRQ